MVDEKTYLLRIPAETYARVRELAALHNRSANWTMTRLLAKAVKEDADWIADALR